MGVCVLEGMAMKPTQSPAGTGGLLGLGLAWAAQKRWVLWSGAAPQQHFSSFSPAAPNPFSWGKAGLAVGFLWLIYQTLLARWLLLAN